MNEPQSHDARISSDPRFWVDRYGDSLYSFALTRLRDISLAEDMVQDTFLAALKARDQFSGLSDERTWLTSILKHKIVDHFRRTSKEISADVEPDDLSSDPDFGDSAEMPGAWKPDQRPSDWGANPHDELERAEFRRHLQACLQSLPESLARAFVLREIEELHPEKICNVLNVTATNLRVLMYRARKGLRRCLENHWLEKGKGRPDSR